jgi:hypothetical protein
MRSRIDELHYQYCVPKPEFKFHLFDTEQEEYPDDESEAGQAQIQSINIYVNLVV